MVRANWICAHDNSEKSRKVRNGARKLTLRAPFSLYFNNFNSSSLEWISLTTKILEA